MIQTISKFQCEQCKQPIIMSGDHVMYIQMGVTTVNRKNMDYVSFIETDSKLIHASCFVDMMTKDIFK